MQKIIDDDIMEPATEALLRKRSLDVVLDTYLKQLDKKLKSTNDCDTLLKKVKEDQSKFNNALKVMMDAKVKYDKGTIDKNQFKTLTRDAYKDISKYCKTFKVKMSDFGSGGFNAQSNITKEDIIDFKQYVTKLIAGIVAIKKKRSAFAKEMDRNISEKSTFNNDMKKINEEMKSLTKSKATESVLSFEEIFNFETESPEDTHDIVTESATISTELGKMSFNTGYKIPLSINWNNENINVTVKATAYKPEDGLTPEQTKSINMISKNIDKYTQKMLSTLKKCDSDIKNYKPKTILIKRDGSIALLCDDAKHPDDGVAICIKPKCYSMSQDDYL